MAIMEVEWKVEKNLSDQICKQLLGWYDQNHRDLPWRNTKDPYHIWVSEIMLQQTRVDTVIPYYERFMEKFPTIQTLAHADEESVIKAWEGLGYYSRARNLHGAAKEVTAKYDGQVPQHPDDISTLRGVGPYTAGAILSIAYNLKAPAVDGNVMRVFSRLFALHDDIARPATRRLMEKVAMKLIPDDRPGDFNQALMELGAMICTPKSPQCLACPLHHQCEAFDQDLVLKLPVKQKAKKVKLVRTVFTWIEYKGQVLMEKRPTKGLLAGMWGFPTLTYSKTITPQYVVNAFCEEQGIAFQHMKMCGTLNHIFTHRRWDGVIMQVYVNKLPVLNDPNLKWIDIDSIEDLALPTVYKKVSQLVELGV
nr:A/G-specific adenine glycosylase [Polycladospora coralii]